MKNAGLIATLELTHPCAANVAAFMIIAGAAQDAIVSLPRRNPWTGQFWGIFMHSDPLFSVSDQIVLVSGASRGIGRAIAAGFAARGANVVITGREKATLADTASEIATAEGPVTPIVCDVTDAKAIARLVDETIARFGRIDTLVNVAGVNRRKPAEELTEEDFDFVIDINLKGCWLLSQAVGRHMLARGGGNQIHIASLNTDRPLPWVLPYAMSKAGVGHMTRVLAMEWASRGVRVNAIAPGFILTDLTKKLWSSPTMQAWKDEITPQQRLGTSEDMIGTAIFLASQASAFMTGQVLYVDGGVTAGIRWPIERA
jgi:gluconate 5-dehydrogenase